MSFHPIRSPVESSRCAAFATPGTRRTAASILAYSAGRSSGRTPVRCTSTPRISRRSGSNPKFWWVSVTNVRMNRPAPTSSTSERATCTTTSGCPSMRCRSPAIVRPCSFIASPGSTRDARSAGASPKSRAVPTATTIVNASARQSSDTSTNTVSRNVVSWPTRSRLPHTANARPRIAPAPASSRLSVSSWRASLGRRHPSRGAGSARAAGHSRGPASGSRCSRTRSPAPGRRSPSVSAAAAGTAHETAGHRPTPAPARTDRPDSS